MPSSSGSGVACVELVPAHVRHGQAGRELQLADVAGNDAEAIGRAFLGALEQDLHAEADA